MHGVEKSRFPDRNLMALTLFLSPIRILPFSPIAAESYGKIRAMTEKSGNPIGTMDTLITAHALSSGLTIVTNNTREFERVSGSEIENRVRTE